MERGFNAGQRHSSIYPSIFNRLRAIARYWSEIATFSYPLHLTLPLGCSNWNSRKKFGPQKTRIIELPGSEDSLTIGWAVSTQYQRVTDRQTDGRTDRRTDVQPIAITCAVTLTHVKNERISIMQNGHNRSDTVSFVHKARKHICKSETYCGIQICFWFDSNLFYLTWELTFRRLLSTVTNMIT